METRNIYKKPRYDYEKELTKIEESPLTAYTKGKIKGFHNYLSATGTGKYRICKLSGQIRLLLSVWNSISGEKKDLSKFTKQELEQIVGWINQRVGWTEATKSDYRRCLKQFFKWYEEIDPRLKDLPEIDILAEREEQITQHRARQEAQKQRTEASKFYKYIHNHIKISYNKPQKDPSEIITDADARLVITKGARSSRDRAFIGVLHEGGLRAAELLNLRIRDLEHKGDRVLLHVDGKTGRRPVPIILNMSYLLKWLDDHPHKEARDAYIWTGLSSVNKDKPIFHSAATRLVDKAFKRAGVNKKHNLHWFRHSRASLYYGRFTEGEMCDFFGWARGSDMVKTYSHTKNDGAQSALNRIYNLQTKEEKEVLSTCGACGLHNTANASYCSRCGQALNTEAIRAKEDYLKLAFEAMGKVMSDPKLKKEFEEYLQKQD